MLKIGVFSLEKDLHAHTVLHALNALDDVRTHFVATDTMIAHGGLHWRNGHSEQGWLQSYHGDWFAPGELDLIWWRRVNQPQQECYRFEQHDPVTADLVNNEWKTAIAGVVSDQFSGVWVNPPHHDVTAGNKLYQLTAAQDVGLRIPQTIVSSQPAYIRQFCRQQNNRIIAKKLMGTARKPLATVLLDYHQLNDDVALQACPTMYQEYIQGNRHVRVNVFGDEVHAILIQCETLDWRRDLSGQFTPHTLPQAVQDRLIMLNRRLGLRMSVMDMMYSHTGELIWLELNTQGQFLFGEALSGYDLITPCARFLVNEARHGNKQSARHAA